MTQAFHAPPSRALGRWHAIAAAALIGASLLITADVWADMFRTGWRDEESGHILVVPFVFAWLMLVRRKRWKECRAAPGGPWVGLILLAVGWASWSYGYRSGQHTFWDAGAILAAVGALLSVTGSRVLWRFLPAFVVLAFLIPVWPVRRQQIAWPMEVVTARITQMTCEVFGMDVARRGNLLSTNGIDVAIAEACNGMRMVLTLMLVIYVYVFVTPLKASVRAAVLVLAPAVAIASNVIRLVPTVWMYGHASRAAANRFHDTAGWVMLAVALLLLMGLARVLRWAIDPVSPTPRPSPAPTETPPSLRPKAAGPAAWWPAFLSLLLLSGMGAEKLTFLPPSDAAPFHKRVRDAVAALPLRIGDWAAQEVQTPYDVIDRLRPNVLISRHYENLVDGREASLILVQCEDARLLVGHYPPACYPHSGYLELASRPREWTIGNLRVTGMEYEFAADPKRPLASRIVDNFMLMPDGRIERDIEPVDRAAEDVYSRFYGAAEIQVAFDADVPPQSRDEAMKTLLQGCEPVLKVLLSGRAGGAR